jgi:hypothetical protein
MTHYPAGFRKWCKLRGRLLMIHCPAINSWLPPAVGVGLTGMKTLTVEEATPGLDHLVELALAGEHIQIRNGNGVVELRPAQPTQTMAHEKPAPREALRRLQEDARLTPQQADAYLHELREERLAAESRGPA